MSFTIRKDQIALGRKRKIDPMRYEKEGILEKNGFYFLIWMYYEWSSSDVREVSERDFCEPTWYKSFKDALTFGQFVMGTSSNDHPRNHALQIPAAAL